MTESLVREITEAVVQEQLLSNWRVYAILIALTLLSSAVSAFILSYLRRRAETYATKSDLEELVRQLQATTKAAEEVRTAIAHADWSTREWKSLRRAKLEELLTTIYDIRHWLDLDLDARFFNKSGGESKSPIWRLEVVSRLYFPELEDEVQALCLVYTQYSQWMINLQLQLNQAGLDAAKRGAVFSSLSDGVKVHHQSLLAAIGNVEKRAPQLMQEIVGA